MDDDAAREPERRKVRAIKVKPAVQCRTGGRVLGVTGLGTSVKLAIEKAYEGVKKIDWEKVHYRNDIGQKALKYFK